MNHRTNRQMTSLLHGPCSSCNVFLLWNPPWLQVLCSRQTLNVTIRAPGSDFIPSESMVEQCPYIQKGFFKRPLPETDRRRFLFECPKNSLRNYDPPKLNKVCLSSTAKQHYTQLYNIQYRLSGITRPLDWYTYQLLHGNWDLPILQQQSLDMVLAIHELLSDLASHITTRRTDSMSRGISNQFDAPSIDSNYLLDPKEMVDHVKLQQTVQ
ncbi:unnamed protein product [Rhizopus microsporus]